MTALVTVVVAVHDVRAYLDACVDSLLAQAEADLEIVLVDDGSTDGSGARCDEYAAADARVRVVHQANAGLSAARNAGLDLARGEFVRFVDGDDWCDPDLVAMEVAMASQHEADVVISGCHVDVLDTEGRLVSSTTRRPPLHTIRTGDATPPDVDLELVGLLGYAWNKLYRRELLTTHGIRFTVGLALVEDIVFNERVLLDEPGCRADVVGPRPLRAAASGHAGHPGARRLPRPAPARPPRGRPAADPLAGGAGPTG